MLDFEFKTKNGAVKIQVQDNIMLTRFNGAVCESITEKLGEFLEQIIKHFNGEPWAYLCYSEEVDAATPRAFEMLIEHGKKGYLNGCVKSCYVLKSFVAINQAQKIRDKLNVQEPLEDVMFDSLKEAKAYLQQFFLAYNASSNKPSPP